MVFVKMYCWFTKVVGAVMDLGGSQGSVNVTSIVVVCDAGPVDPSTVPVISMM
jgi:hypothetical protein